MASLETPPHPTLQDWKLLTEVSQLLTSLDLEMVMREVMRLMSQAVGATKASLFLHDDGQIDWNHIFLMREMNRDESIVALRTVMDEGLAGWVVRNRAAALVEDTATDSRWHVFPDDSVQQRSVLCVPLIQNERVLAVLTLAHPQPGQFDSYQLDLVQIIANQAAVAIRNAQLFHQIQSQQHQVEGILRALPEILFVLDQRGKILLINDGVLNLLGGDQILERQDIVGHMLEEFIGDGQPGRLLAPAQRIISQPPPTSDPWSFETRNEEQRRDFQVTIGVWDNPRQQASGYTLLMHDVTTLRDLHRFKDEMLKIVSHDLRNPVSLIISARDMVEADMPPVPAGSDIPQYLEIIRQATLRMETLLDDLVRTGGSSQRQINPQEIIETVAARMRPLAERKNQRLEMALELQNFVPLVADPMLIAEAMENYVSNAVKYTPKKGRITIRAYSQEGRFYYIVEDTGIGVASEHVTHLFEPYYRPPGTVEQGYGIGLNLVKTIVERHQGGVWVESAENIGSKFGFWLPLSP